MSCPDRLEFLNIVPMLPEYREQLAADTLEQDRRGCVTSTAFILTLVPEGEPPADKARFLGERFGEFRAALGRTDMPVGILLQATMGHGWTPNSRSNFQRIITGNGGEPYIFCPLDEGFRRYVHDAVRRLAVLKPDFFMVDDDFRLLTGRDGCFCPLHLARFNREHGTEHDRISLRQAAGKDPEVAAEYDTLLQQSLVELAREIRSAIDATDPAIPCTFCTCSRDVRHAPELVRTLAAPGQTPTVRINNARYLNESLRTVPEWMMFTARQAAALPRSFKLLAEPDTFPHNRYSTSAAMMHLQLTGSILEGCRGGKLWLHRTRTWEPESGRRYRDILAKNSGFYRTLAGLPVKWTGAATVLPVQPHLNFPAAARSDSNRTWSTQVLGKMGIPFHFTTAPSGIVTLAGRDCDALDDLRLAEILGRCGCLLDGPAAIAVCKRGFAGLLGAEARPWHGKTVSQERTDGGGLIPTAASDAPGGNVAELTPHPGAEVLSRLYHIPSGVSPEEEFLLPGTIFHTNSGGGRIAVTAQPVLPYGLTAFGMLNQTRKAQLLDLFKRLGGLPWYVPGDAEVMLRTGKIPGYDLAILTDLSLDEEPELLLAGPAEQVAAAEELQPDGSWLPVPFRRESSILRLERALRPLQPVVIRLKLFPEEVA